jgi:uncharacterized phiE125 gp8 family phage protein
MGLVSNVLDPKGNRSWKITTPPGVEPITCTEVKDYGRIDGSEEDSLITGFITAVREATELYLGRALIEQSIRLSMDFWPSKTVELPCPPLISITQIGLLDESSVTTVYSSSSYFTVSDAIPGQVVIKTGNVFPTNTSRSTAGIFVDYMAGYGSTATYVPRAIKEAMKLWAVAMYEDRAISPEPPPDARKLLSLFRVIKV